MGSRVLMLIATKKGGFIAESDEARRNWKIQGPYLPGKNVMHVAYDPRTGTMFAPAWDWWFGARVHRSFDLGATWDEPVAGPNFGRDDVKLEKVWSVQPGRPQEPGVIYAGVEPAALFKSTDNGETWELVESLWCHPTRPEWVQGNGGLMLHTIMPHPTDLQRLSVAISVAGVFSTEDCGATWSPSNQGISMAYDENEPPTYPEWGQCVHMLAQYQGKPERLFAQNHTGVFRSDDRGKSWSEISEGLPSDWGLPMVGHPHDADTVYISPGVSSYYHWMPKAGAAVYRTRNAGGAWERLAKGLPSRNAFINVMRDGLATDTLDTPGVYLGANTGQLFYSSNEGATWKQLSAMFPPINAVEVAVV